ncbi:MAG: UDP-3-O-(3-hydroxymyristoyl)glucosamine N-acyltransferase [Synergistaceae bacterium]|nr:UDP-3-O-(3-hydroxymyristoyl)glucosamine N-acyltransferase [Synergistaceae bacterium]
MKQYTLKEIASITGGKIVGDETLIINGVSAPDSYVQGTICPLWEKKYEKYVMPEMVLFTVEGQVAECASGIVFDKNPKEELIKLLNLFDESPKEDAMQNDLIAPDAKISETATVCVGAIIKSGAVISDGAIIKEYAVIGENVFIGKGTIVESHVVIYHGTIIEDECIIRSHAVIGCPGFGFMPDKECGIVRVPQIGIAHIKRGVEVGAYSSIDRATFGETLIGDFTKIDSHVKIGHNCRIGTFCVFCGRVGLAGSTIVGNGVTFAAGSGAGNHVTIGDGVMVGGLSGVSTNIPAGAVVSGFPAQDHKKELRYQASLRRVPDLIKKIKELEIKLEKLEGN